MRLADFSKEWPASTHLNRDILFQQTDATSHCQTDKAKEKKCDSHNNLYLS
jgi:hypothetical protein